MTPFSKLFSNIPSELSKNASRYQATSVLGRSENPETMSEMLRNLEDSLTVNFCHHSNDPNVGFPMHADYQQYKLYMGDTGLFVTLAFWDRNVTENIIYQKLLSDKLSAAWIWSRIRRIGRSRYNLFKEKLGYLEGGSKPLIMGMADTIINNKGHIYSNSLVKKVLKNSNGTYSLDIDLTKSIAYSKDSPVLSDTNFDFVVSTIPLPYIPSIFNFINKEAHEKFAKTINIGVVCIIVKLSKALTNNFWLNTNDPDMDIPGIIEYSNLNPCNGEHIVYVPYYMPTTTSIYNDSDDIYKAKIKNYFKKINPELQDSDFKNIVISRYKCAQPICGPEYLKTIPQIKIDGENVFIADTSYYYPEDRGVSEGIKIAKTIKGLIDAEAK